MKKILIIVLGAVGLWWYFIGGRTISEEDVDNYFLQQQHATLMRDPELLCSMLDDEFTMYVATRDDDSNARLMGDREQACDNYYEMYDNFETLGEKMGGILQLDYSYEVHQVTIAPDKKSALVDVSYSMDVAGSIMNIRMRSTETLIRKNGKTLMQRSIAHSHTR